MIDDLLEAVGAKDIADIGEMVLELVGNKVVVISNMLGVLMLDSNEIHVKASKHQKAVIKGEMLEVREMNKNEMTIAGRIHSVHMEAL